MDQAGRRKAGDLRRGVGHRTLPRLDGTGAADGLSRVRWERWLPSGWVVRGYGDKPAYGRAYYVTNKAGVTQVVTIREVKWVGLDSDGYASWKATVAVVGTLDRAPHEARKPVPDVVDVPY